MKFLRLKTKLKNLNNKNMFKFKIHSVIDVITNSSTEIYTWYDRSVGACKEMINEFLTSFNLDKKVEDVFYIDIFCDVYTYTDYLDERVDDYLDELEEDSEEYSNMKEFIDNLPSDWKLRNEKIESLISDILVGKEVRPEWMRKCETYEDSYNYRVPSNYFYIKAKRPEYNNLAKKINTFLKSPDHDASYDG